MAEGKKMKKINYRNVGDVRNNYYLFIIRVRTPARAGSARTKGESKERTRGEKMEGKKDRGTGDETPAVDALIGEEEQTRKKE